MFIFLLFFLFFASASPARAQSLYHQMIESYYPAENVSSPLPQLLSDSPLSGLTSDINSFSPAVLGITTHPSPLLQNILPAIGGDPGSPAGTSNRPFTIALLGDSMIDTLGPDLPALALALQKYYPGLAADRQFRFINYGVGASHLEYALYRLTHNYDYLDSHYPSLVSQQPDLIILESFAYNNFGNSQSALNRYRRDLDLITASINQELPNTKLLLAATLAPNSITFGNGIDGLRLSSLDKIEKSSTIKLYFQNFINYAAERNLPLADAYHPSLLNNDGNPDYINPADNLHPSPKGAALFSQIVAKTIFDNQLLSQ